MRRWIGFACAAAALCAAAWHFGRPNKAPAVSGTVAVVLPTPVEVAPAPPPKVLDIIDLARAYEPVPEPEQVLPGGIDPATFIEEPSAPSRIPPAAELDGPYSDVIRTVVGLPPGRDWRSQTVNEHIDLTPRQITEPGGGLESVQAWQEWLAAWLIGSWSGPTTCPKLTTESLRESDR